MIKTRITCQQVAEPAPRLWSNCIRVNDTVYLSGMVGTHADGSVAGDDEFSQSRAAFGKIRNLMEAAGGSMDDIVKLTIFVTCIASSSGVRRARDEFFQGDFPTSSMVEVARLGRPELLVEIEAIGHVGCAT